MIVKKTKSLEQGYVWIPYIIEETTTIVSEGSWNISKRYRKRRRINKIKNIIENHSI